MVNKNTLWGMIHVPALPGSYRSQLSFKEIIDFCLIDTETLVTNGITHLFIENFWNVPFPKSNSQPHIIAGITIIVEKIKTKFPEVTLGINILRNDALSALGIASMTGSKVIRVNVLTHARLTDQGIIEGCAYDLKTYSGQLNSPIKIWADIEVKHSVPLSPVPIEDAINDAIERGGADKVVFSGTRTGMPVKRDILLSLIDNGVLEADLIVIGSGINQNNLKNYLDLANNFIVGSSLKLENKLHNHIDPKKVTQLVESL
jgi:membrane complex biogenesis BtpA family protein